MGHHLHHLPRSPQATGVWEEGEERGEGEGRGERGEGRGERGEGRGERGEGRGEK